MLRVENLNKTFTTGVFKRRRHKAVDQINFTIAPGEILGLVGESGCGKSTLARLLLNLIPSSSGKLYFKGQELTGMRGRELRKIRGKMQIIFQHPESSLNPRLKIYDSLIEPMRIQNLLPSKTVEREKVLDLLHQVGLDEEHLTRYPHELSGGQIQRVVLARILAVQPEFIIADEPTSMLDVSVQAQVLHLLKDIQQKHAMSFLFISHDLALVQWISERIAVMYRGQIVEIGPAQDLCNNPRHPYSVQLVETFNWFQENKREKSCSSETTNQAIHAWEGCAFAPCCPKLSPVCRQKPELRRIAEKHDVACWHA